MELLFVAMTGDAMAEEGIRALAAMNYPTRILGEGEVSPEGSIALFTPLNAKQLGSRRRWIMCSVRKINRVAQIPGWVATTFRAAVVKTFRYEYHRSYGSISSQHPTSDGFLESLRNLARCYAEWEPGNSLWEPWDSKPRHLRRKILLKDYRTVRINAWDVNFSDQVRVFSDAAVEQSLALINQWQCSFRLENTWSRRELGTPSLIVRLDCVVHDGQLTVYEVEERPSGLGVSSLANPFFKDRLAQILKTWPDFRVVVSDQRAGTDDFIWMESLNRPIRQDAELVLVRAEPEETQFHGFEPQSVSSLIAKGDKAYGETLKLWRRVRAADELPWDQGFVLKPKQGSKMHDVKIWDLQHRPGSAHRSRIEAAMSKHGSMFLQPLVDPMKTGHPQFEWMIYRVFFGFNPIAGSWECLGGNWNARSNLRIHGASDALFGPVVLT